MRKLGATAFAFLLLSPALWAAPSTPKPAPAAPSPEQQAVEHYNRGLEHQQKAWDHEKKAATAKEPQKELGKARAEYEKAVAEQREATRLHPRFHEAFSSLGYALRKTGDYQGALKSYDTALSLKPEYAEAVEYRAEAYLGLNRIEEAQQAYEWLFLRDPKKAAALLVAFKGWVAAGPTGVAPEKVAEVQTWVGQKEAAAQEMSGTKESGKQEW
jgi:tetratricopeptide (TPR) repeat protein